MRKSWNIIVKKIFLAGLCGSLVISNVSVSSTVKAEKTVDMTSEKNYIISVNSAKQLKAVGENYDSFDVLNTNAEGCLEENNMAAVTLNERELSNLRNSGSVEFVEPDLIMKASTEENEEEYHEKQIFL